MIRKKIYGWHRKLSLIAAVPMIMWTVSGMLHQAGQWFKPKTKMELVKVEVDSSAIQVSLEKALSLNGIDTIMTHRVVEYRNEFYYQVRVKKNEPCIYLNVKDGSRLGNGDEKYAVSLAFKMLGDDNAHIGHREFITRFSDKYRKSAKVLPVYGLSIHDDNHTHLYIDTYGGKLTASDNKQKHAIHQWFGYLHSWKFLDRWHNAKAIALTLYSLIAFVAAVLGIYLYVILPALSKEKRAKNGLNRRRSYHRWIGIIASFSMLLFAFSGALHALVDILPVDNTSAGPWHKVIFDQLHMFRFTQAVSKDFRFWLLMIFAFINLLTVVTGLVMVTRFVLKGKKKAIVGASRRSSGPQISLALQPSSNVR